MRGGVATHILGLLDGSSCGGYREVDMALERQLFRKLDN